MRILFITSYYPPYEIGGWPQLVFDLNRGLQSRGHETGVLTTHHGLPAPSIEGDIARVLYPEAHVSHYRPMSMLGYRRRRQWNLGQTEAVIHYFNPDIISVHMLWNLSRGVPWMAEQLMPGRVVHYLASVVPYQEDPHEAYWRDPGHRAVLSKAKRFLAPYALRMVESDLRRFQFSFDHLLCVSEASREALADSLNRAPEDLVVLHNGIELDLFYPATDRTVDEDISQGIQILFAGNLVAHKGAHTVIEALAVLAHLHPSISFQLNIAGSGHPDYEDSLRQLVVDSGLGDKVRFLGRIPREQMPVLMRRNDIFVLPSIWEEPLARAILEAMASGLAVVGTATGGTGEVLINGETGLVFQPGDAEALAERLIMLANYPELRCCLGQNARRLMQSKFDLNQMIDEFEVYLQNVVVGV